MTTPRKGRPPIFHGARAHTVQLTEPDAIRLREFGAGSVSMGISVLLNGPTGSGTGSVAGDEAPVPAAGEP